MCPLSLVCFFSFLALVPPLPGKNLRSSFRLINQGKHPSHYTKETWPFYSQLERYVEQKAEFDKHPDGPLPTLGALIDTSVNEAKLDDSDDNEGEDDEDDDEEEGGEGKAAKSEGKRGKKRERTASADGRTPTTTAAGANFYPTAGGSMPQELLNALKPKDVTRKERDWAATVRALNAHMVTSIQDSHQVSTTDSRLADNTIRICRRMHLIHLAMFPSFSSCSSSHRL